jgi:outer membrane protein TolC
MSALRTAAALPIAFALAGCAGIALDEDARELSAYSSARIGAPVARQVTEEERRQAREATARLIEQPISADDAVRVALLNSAALQALLSDAAAASAEATQSARLPNPVFTFERLVRNGEPGAEKEITRMLAFPLLEVVALPARGAAARSRQERLRLESADRLLQAATQARQAWVRAVGAQEAVAYFEQVRTAADAGAELARRMQIVGSASRLQRSREHAFYADAQAQLARAMQQAQASREALVRALGLDAAQAPLLKLPARLPDLPAAPDDESVLMRSALDERLDLRMARAALDETARREGLSRVTSYVDGLQVAAVSKSETGAAPWKGYEIELPLPIFEFGDARRANAQASYMAALQRTAAAGARASSEVRESYAAYRTAYDLARHYRDEVVPLRKTIADEMLLRYNGMLASVFDLLSDAREQAASVAQAIDARRDFWLADAALRAALLGSAT